MKTRFTLRLLLPALFLAIGLTVSAQSTASADVPAPRELTIVVVESLRERPGGLDNFHWIDQWFTAVFSQRKWPVKINAERLAGNSPAHDPELRIFYQGIRKDTPFELTFRAWVTLMDHGTKHDFGIVRFIYAPRPGQQQEDVIEHLFRGAAGLVADKIEPILFPKADPAKP